MKDGELFYQDEVVATWYGDSYLKFWIVDIPNTDDTIYSAPIIPEAIRAHQCRIEPSGVLAFYISGDLVDSYAAGYWSGCYRQPKEARA